MTATINEITRLLGGQLGPVASTVAHRQANRAAAASPGLRQLLAELGQRPSAAVKVPTHPEQNAEQASYRRDRDEDLSPVELVWLQRLSQDPAKITFEDATRLAALADSVSKMKTPASARLVASIWEPVKALHDHRVAAAKLEQARQPLPSIPASAVDAVTDVLVTQHPGVSRGALTHEATQILTEMDKRRQAVRQAAIGKSEQALAAVERRAIERQATEDINGDRRQGSEV